MGLTKGMDEMSWEPTARSLTLIEEVEGGLWGGGLQGEDLDT